MSLALSGNMAAWLSQEDYGSGAGGAMAAAGGCVMGLIYLGVMLIALFGLWKMYEKAGKPGWAAIIPIYNVIVMLEIVARPLWWVVLMFIPLVNVVVYILVLVELARRFGKGVGYAIGMLFLPFIFFPLLGFGDATYRG